MTDQITIPRETWNAMREALKEIISAHPATTSLRQAAAVIEARKALTAATAVSHANPETAPPPEGGAITSESAANAVSEHVPETKFGNIARPQATEPAEKEDPLQGAVDWLLQADGEFFAVATVQRTLRIGYNRAKRLADIARERAAAPEAKQ